MTASAPEDFLAFRVRRDRGLIWLAVARQWNDLRPFLTRLTPTLRVVCA